MGEMLANAAKTRTRPAGTPNSSQIDRHVILNTATLFFMLKCPWMERKCNRWWASAWTGSSNGPARLTSWFPRRASRTGRTARGKDCSLGGFPPRVSPRLCGPRVSAAPALHFGRGRGTKARLSARSGRFPPPSVPLRGRRRPRLRLVVATARSAPSSRQVQASNRLLGIAKPRLAAPWRASTRSRAKNRVRRSATSSRPEKPRGGQPAARSATSRREFSVTPAEPRSRFGAFGVKSHVKPVTRVR